MTRATTTRGTYRTGRERIEQILDAAHEAFITAGYRATSLRDIARDAGISHPALLRYFSSRGAILTALIERLDAQNAAFWNHAVPGDAEWPGAADIARVNQNVPGWVQLFTALLGEATSPVHPGHEQMLARRQEAVRRGEEALEVEGLTPVNAEQEIRRLIAGWEGLQILWLYFPDGVDIVGQLEQHAEELDEAADEAAHEHHPPTRRRRRSGDDLTAAAAQLYARHGYHETSMQAVADAAGISRAALIHVAPTKRALLLHVIAGLFDADGAASATSPLGDHPQWSTAAEMVLICEATVPSHPAHDLITARLASARETVTAELRDGGVADAESEADWVISVCLGSLIAWLYEPDDVDPTSLVQRTVARVRKNAPRANDR